jgi:hypothetical protein
MVLKYKEDAELNALFNFIVNEITPNSKYFGSYELS